LRASGSTQYGKMPEEYATLSNQDKRVWRRQALAQNCSVWASFSRWCTIHGTHGVTFRNNVCFVCYGSGVFVESGTETDTTIDHNFMARLELCIARTYENPVPIYPNVSSDLVVPGFIWLKTGEVRVIRNVSACAPTGVTNIWLIPQGKAALRFPGITSYGDSTLKLPSIAGTANLMGDTSDRIYLSSYENRWADMTEGVKPNPPCWVPDDWFATNRVFVAGVVQGSAAGSVPWGCTPMSKDNSTAPSHIWSDNVSYQVMSANSNFPEALAHPPPGWDGRSPSFQGCVNNGLGPAIPWTNAPQWLPWNGQTCCTDSKNVAQSPYMMTAWGAGGVDKDTNTYKSSDYPYQPIDKTTWLPDYNEQNITRTEDKLGALIPIIITNQISYSCGTSGPLIPGGGWLKQTPVHMYSCAFIETSYRTSNGTPGVPWNQGNATGAPQQERFQMEASNTKDNPGQTNGVAGFTPAYSAAIHIAGGTGNSAYGGIYHVMYDCIFNGGVLLPSNNTIYGGKAMLFGDYVNLVSGEYTSHAGSLCNMHVFDLPDHASDALDALPANFWKQRYVDYAPIGLYDYKNEQGWRSMASSGVHGPNPEDEGTMPEAVTWAEAKIDVALPTRKNPYLCSESGALFLTQDALQPEYGESNPEWRNIVANAQLRAFVTNYAITMGNRMCNQLSRVPKCFRYKNNMNNEDTSPVCCGVTAPENSCA